jgi:AmmeMemoRadiSam system protein B/AmmeMemoRadiSam system protein A
MPTLNSTEERTMSKVAAIALCLFALARWQTAIGGDEMNGSDTTYVRPPAVAGAFYPGTATELAKMIATQLHAADKPVIEGRPLAIISPHAGYIYSGGIAAKGYKILEGETVATVIIISPSHAAYFPGVTAFDGKAYTTPLGEVEIDRELTKEIASGSNMIDLSNIGHVVSGARSEHALEVQLPFLQTTLGKFKLVALMMGDQDFKTCEALGKAIGEAVDGRDDVLIVASSDLSHFHDSQTAKRLDSMVIERVKTFDYRGLADDLAKHKSEACGGGPIAAAMIAAESLGGNSVEITGYGDSGDITGDKSNVVGYLSAIVYKSGESKVYDLDEGAVEDVHDNPATGVEFGLTTDDKKILLNIARQAIAATLNDEKLPPPESITDGLIAKLGAFVTLNKDGTLRGCIGTFTASEPLYLTVARMAREAAFSDPRFDPVGKGELDSLHIEISVLTPMKKINDPESVEVGRDGLYIRQGYRSGVLLPQVPVEYGWDRMKFLQHTCLKAGLPTDAWKSEETELFVFQAEIFGED